MSLPTQKFTSTLNRLSAKGCFRLAGLVKLGWILRRAMEKTWIEFVQPVDAFRWLILSQGAS